MSALLFNWALALIFLSFCLIITARSRNIGKAGLSSVWTIASFIIYAILVIMGTAQGGAYIAYIRAFFRLTRSTRQGVENKADLSNKLLYAFYALWYTTAFFIGALNFRAHSVARRAGVVDKVLKTLLFFALPLYVCHVIEDLAFTIIDSPAGLKSDNFEVYERANLAEIILMNTFHAATIIVLIHLGLRKSNWTSNASSDPWNKGYYPSYPMQPAYMPVQTAEYSAQMNYTTQNQYVDNSNAHLVPQHTQ
ncbi:uncharacterized protein FOMMEDRAFT_22243 [Fomitiporia mediterranea MF3/22]|uniref:uncharacterized protein n=1 Tax=Fomitiporia mediterranea (strain MF3/22) TaxID=694068 RepID=UPI0004409BDA|nr:uncharacterized protein FOMMEDRAFT_22243 [Fomitiporia mediterranea MF3/22]EJD00442.1 hypothetical protein FOMMEDRAFT_22243 [Fomitiporia mediterranea MF3/22]